MFVLRTAPYSCSAATTATAKSDATRSRHAPSYHLDFSRRVAEAVPQSVSTSSHPTNVVRRERAAKELQQQGILMPWTHPQDEPERITAERHVLGHMAYLELVAEPDDWRVQRIE